MKESVTVLIFFLIFALYSGLFYVLLAATEDRLELKTIVTFVTEEFGECSGPVVDSQRVQACYKYLIVGTCENDVTKHFYLYRPAIKDQCMHRYEIGSEVQQ